MQVLDVAWEPPTTDGTFVYLAHLKALTHLKWCDPYFAGHRKAVLPAQLSSLDMRAAVRMTGGKGLRRVHIEVGFSCLV